MAEKAQHTQGPWAILPEECDRPYIRIRGNLGSRYKVANVITPVYDGSTEREAEETRANARLIAAAPDLLIEVKKQLDWLRHVKPQVQGPSSVMMGFDQSIKYLAAAIAKATTP